MFFEGPLPNWRCEKKYAQGCGVSGHSSSYIFLV